jgi:hypothetical protein
MYLIIMPEGRRKMTEQAKHSERFHEARRQFDELKLEDKAVFLLEATVTTLARGLEHAGKALGDAMERAFDEAERAAEEASSERKDATSENGNGAAAPDPDMKP